MIHNQNHIIYHTALRRAAMAVAAIVIAFAWAMASETWDGSKATSFAGGDGTAENPYQIANGAQLKLLQSYTVANSPYLSKHYILTDDIDLGGRALGMIGNGTDTSDDSFKTAFTGSFDGDGYVISNLLINVGSPAVSATNCAFGLFGYVRGATLRNITIDNAAIELQSQTAKYDIKVGVLAGALAPVRSTAVGQTAASLPATRIENVIITNTRVYVKSGKCVVPSIFLGSLVGDITSSFGGYENTSSPVHESESFKAFGQVIIRNIYADVDINLSAESFEHNMGSTDAKRPQYNVGGIIGRMRRGRYDFVPVNTYYTGSIVAPYAIVGPCWSALRNNALPNPETSLVTSWAGEVYPLSKVSNDGYTVLSGESCTLGGTTVQPNAHRYFGAYSVNGVDIDANNPSGDDCLYGTRAIADHTSLTADPFDPNSDVKKKVQGMNHGTYAADFDGAPINDFNAYATGNSGLLQWYMHSGVPSFKEGEFKVQHTGHNTLTAAFMGYSDTFKYRWSGRRGNDDWTVLRTTDLGTATSDVLTYEPDSYDEVRVEILDASNTVVESGFYYFAIPEIKRTGWKDFTISYGNDYITSSYTVEWYGKRRDDEQWEAAPFATSAVTPPATADSKGVYRMTTSIDASNFDVEGAYACNAPEKYAALRAVVKAADGTLYIRDIEMPITVTVARGSTSSATGAYDFTATATIAIEGNAKYAPSDADQAACGYYYKLRGIRNENTVADDTPLAVGTSHNWKQTLQYKHPANYKQMIAVLCAPDGTELAEGAVAIAPVGFNKVSSARQAHSRFYVLVDAKYLKSNDYTIRFYGIPYDSDDVPADLYTNPAYEIGKSAVKNYSFTITLKSTSPVDRYRTVRAVLCDYNETGDVVGAPILNESGEPVFIDFPIEDIGLSIARSGTDKFKPVVVGDSRFGSTTAYKYHWTAVKHDDTRVDLPTTTGEVTVPNISDYKKLECVLYDYNDAVLHSEASVIKAQIEVVDPMKYYHLKIDRDANAAGDKLVYRATLSKNADGTDFVAGGGDFVWTDGTPSVANETLPADGYFWLWEVCGDPADRAAWEGTTVSVLYDQDYKTIGQHGWIAPWRTDRYYRVAYCRMIFEKDGEGNYVLDSNGDKVPVRTSVTDVAGNVRNYVHYERLVENVIGPKHIVYLYNKDRTEVGRGMSTTFKGKTLTVTDFDGKDRSVLDEDGTTIRRDIYGREYDSEYPDGDDFNTGYAPYAAVKTLKRAYEVLDANGTEETNVIVVMGYYYAFQNSSDANDKPIFGNDITATTYNKPATITGEWGKLITSGALYMTDGNTDSQVLGLGARTRFENLKWIGYQQPDNTSTRSILRLYCNRHDLTIGDGLKIMGYSDMPSSQSSGLGIIEGKKSPHINIMGGQHDYNLDEPIPARPNNREPDVTHIEINSGAYGRILCASRNSKLNPVTHNVYGSFERPHRAKTWISITHTTDMQTNKRNVHEYTLDAEYDYDVGLLVGGQTDGTVYAESELYMNDGSVGRFISGNISYGRSTDGHTATSGPTGDVYPSDSYIGSAYVKLTGGTIDELYGGSLGRHQESTLPTAVCDAYFYGRSMIHVDGGVINSTVYGAGAGGVTGVGRCEHIGHHTTDRAIPYYPVGATKAKYDSYVNIKQAFTDNPPEGWTADSHVADFLPKFRMNDGSLLPIGTSDCQVLLTGGVVNGDVYGGGYGYSFLVPQDRALDQAGDVFGNVTVTMRADHATPPTVTGNIYGGGSGSDGYVKDYKAALVKAGKSATEAEAIAKAKFGEVARVFGSTTVNLIEGTVDGDVFAGSKGVGGYENMATVYGNCTLDVGKTADRTDPDKDSDADGPTIEGNVYGGCDFANISFSDVDLTKANSGHTYINVMSGIIGNCIYGGSKGSDGSDGNPITSANIAGSTNVTVTGGWFESNPYINKIDKTDGFRSFNIYGGGRLNCTVDGDANVLVTHSLMRDSRSFMSREDNPNSYSKPDGTVTSIFQAHYMDITFRRFCVYGGGYGEKTRVLNTNVEINFPSTGKYAVPPDWFTLEEFLKGQSFFDIAGGGFSGDVGYWASNRDDLGNQILHDGDDGYYDEDLRYVGGNCNLIIDGYTYARKIIGGGFYGSCFNTNTDVRCGSLRQIYGGSLLGYVHNRAKLKVGNKWEDFRTVQDTDADGNPKVDGSGNPVMVSLTDDQAKKRAYDLNKYIYVTENMYGGNDVKGIIGTERYKDGDGAFGTESADGGWLFAADTDPSESRGILFDIYGGTFMGDVFGAGNGYYRGYYVPEWVRYNDGPDRMYSQARSSIDPSKTGRIYRSRPMVGSVNLNIRGNSETDTISFKGDFYGGGRECTIGQWNTMLPFEDPRRLVKGGYLHVNIGGHAHFNGNVYMGVYGDGYSKQYALPSGINLDTFDGSTSKELDRLGRMAYTHWYFNSKTRRYEPGFPAPGEVDGNYGMPGEYMFRGYMKNIEMQGDVVLTFFRDLYVLDADGKEVLDPVTHMPHRKRWQPGEFASLNYDAPDVTMNSFFLGGRCGSMTNNNTMRYVYNDENVVSKDDPQWGQTEKWGTIYRVALPSGLTIKNKVVMGSEDAKAVYYPYSNDFTQVIKTKQVLKHNDATGEDEMVDEPIEPYYTFEGGLVTQAPYSFDLIAYNDYRDKNKTPGTTWMVTTTLPDDFYQAGKYGGIANLDTYTMQDGTVLHRFMYDDTHYLFPNYTSGTQSLGDKKYGLAVYYTDGDTSKPHAFIGKRESRERSGEVDDEDWGEKYTVTKLTTRCKFEPQFDCALDASGKPDASQLPEDDPNGYGKLYGAVIYGGCYNSGVVMGDVILNVASDMLGEYLTTKDYQKWIEKAVGLDHFVGRVYGGGFGADSRVDGDTYVNILNDFRGMYVFGGGMLCPINGQTQINYVGTEQSAVYGAIYGGGFLGTVGIPEKTNRATFVNLISGNVARVYGGSCLGDLYGSAVVNLSDDTFTELSHLEYDRLAEIDKKYGRLPGSHLIAGNVYGGNDVSGRIHRISPEKDHSSDKRYSTYGSQVRVYEKQKAPVTPSPIKGKKANAAANEPEEGEWTGDEGPGAVTPGSYNGYNGYPLVGRVYGGSNGNYGTNDGEKYTSGFITLATGEKTQTFDMSLPGYKFKLPHIGSARVVLDGGTIINAYAGGDMATITDAAEMNVQYDEGNLKARAGFWNKSTLDRIWNVFKLESMEQQREIIEEATDEETGNTYYQFKYQVFRIFGGNNHSDMAIQPSWHLTHANVGSVYSGGNFGRMTYFNPNPEADPVTGRKVYGLGLRIDSDDIFIDNVYGGGRVGDIEPDVPEEFDTDATRIYGSTLEIDRGVVNHVYGGNDVSGVVHFGTSVEINGAISGNVYCAGNGNYRYLYDPEYEGQIEECFDDAYGGRYFRLPRRSAGYGGDNPSPAQRVLAINSYRPNVEQASLRIAGHEADPNIEGDKTRVAYVFGNVFCGGNSSTVHYDETRKDVGDIRFSIGSHVTLNGVYLGSDGSELINATMMQQTEALNGIDLALTNDLSDLNDPSGDKLKAMMDELFEEYVLQHNIPESKREEERANFNVPNLYGVNVSDRYPRLLDLYVHAVDVNALPESFDIDDDVVNAYIGDFFVGGNNGSMQANKEIDITLPEPLVIYGKVVGGSNTANVGYKSIKHIGGLTRPLDASLPAEVPKLHLRVKSRFEPWKLDYPVDGDIKKIELVPDVVEKNGKLYFPAKKCMVFGGCYTSGRTVGTIQLDIYSDMVREYEFTSDPTHPDYRISQALAAKGIRGDREGSALSKARIIVDGIDDYHWHSFGVVGGGFGLDTEVHGNINVRMLPGKADFYHTLNASKPMKDADGNDFTSTDDKYKSTLASHTVHPSAAFIFGGSQEGGVVGNILVQLRDGLVLTNLFAGSEAAPIYGSTQVMVGWPKYYVSKARKQYELNVTDQYSQPMRAIADNNTEALYDWTNEIGAETYAVRRRIAMRPGEIMSTEVYKMLSDEDKENFELVDDDMPYSFKAWDDDNEVYRTGLFTWDDISISVGDPRSRTDENAEYFGHGNIYGGGFVSADAAVTIDGSLTVRRFDKKHCTNPADVNEEEPRLSYGGNSTILIWDNYENADHTREVSALDAEPGTGHGTAGALIKDHVSVSTCGYTKVSVAPGMNLRDLYIKDDKGRFIPQAQHKLTEGDPLLNNEYYEMKSDGGIYGGGRKVFVEGYRTCEIGYYGYTFGTPQYPKLINTAQRLDVLSLIDCCLRFNGANDYSTTSIDAQEYSLTRIGELRMISSISPDADLDPGERGGASDLFNLKHETPRQRNYMALNNNVHYLSAITSNVGFDSPYHGANGKKYETGDYMRNVGNKTDRNNPEIYDGSVEGMAAADKPQNETLSQLTYRRYKADRIKYFYANRDADVNGGGEGEDEDATLTKGLKARLAFDQRNVGTSPNMIGLNNGYVLNIQGGVAKNSGVDKVYAGPATGIFEVKLLTLSKNEGGGYIYALNHHDDPNNFLETTGNFVFPGAAYLSEEVEDNKEQYNYVYDDCFPNGRGWDYYYSRPTAAPVASAAVTPTPAPAMDKIAKKSTGASVPVADGHGDTNQWQDVHYWYVNGTNFNFELTMTAYTNLEDEAFVVDNSDAIIYLYGVNPSKKLADGTTEAGSTVTVNSVSWDASKNVEPDLTFSSEADRAKELPYSLFLSLDTEPNRSHSLTDHTDNAYVTAIPRSDYEAGTAPADADANPATHMVNNFTEEYDANGTIVRENLPLVGITLYDKQSDYGDNMRQYYEKHLKEDEHVTIEMKSGEYTYNINLKIKYLLGPTITGQPTIENCALPGEYIYANSYGVNIDLDEDNMTVSKRKWYLFAPELSLDDNDIRQYLEDIHSTGAEYKYHPIIDLEDQKLYNNDRAVHIPAYYYLNDWKVVYEIVANNRSYYRYPNKGLAADDENRVFGHQDHIVVHNYHRMRPWDGTSIMKNHNGDPVIVNGKSIPLLEDLRLSAGARVYIENDDDMARFIEYVREVQIPNHARANRFNEAGLNLDPQYADSLSFYLMADVKMPKLSAEDIEALRETRFKGVWHGNGFQIDMGDNPLCMGIIDGEVYNTGFLSHLESGDADAFQKVTGKVMNCFMYNPDHPELGNLFQEFDSASGEIENCYQTSELPAGAQGHIDKVIVDRIYYGYVAYNLNSFYLRKRYNRALNLEDGDYVRPLNIVYGNGDYRYAKWSETGEPDALRTRPIPNYHDYLNIRGSVNFDNFDGSITGMNASMHNPDHPVDMARVFARNNDDIDVTYRPQFPNDFLFFGQDLSIDGNHPTGITEDNRVYRASGFYGFSEQLQSHCDYGFYFNEDVNVNVKNLSAIDFAGHRDAENGNAYISGWKEYNTHRQHCFFPPMCDLPYKIQSIDVKKDVSQNLLIYYHPSTGVDQDEEGYDVTVVTDPVSEVLDRYKYDSDTPEKDIKYHLIVANVTEEKDGGVQELKTPSTELFHLVDKEQFDAPIEYDVTGTAWYQRDPNDFSSGNNAWETLCLPFTVKTVYGAAKVQAANEKRNHGELTHFYGPAVDLSVEAPSHEYWLRKFTEVKDEKIYFTRPGSEEDAVNRKDETRAEYPYKNTYFADVFKQFQGFDVDHMPDAYNPNGDGVTYYDYPMITMSEPYIVAFPGRKFYEFDLSGKFYNEHVPGSIETPQTITFANRPNYDAGEKAVRIPITYYTGYPKDVTHDGYTLRGTFRDFMPVATTAVIPQGIAEEANVFSRASSPSATVLPFRAYMQRPGSGGGAMPIVSRNVDYIGGQGGDEPDDPSDEIGEPMLSIATDGGILIVTANYDTQLPVYTPAGVLLEVLDIASGVNTFTHFAPGVYITTEAKFLLK